MSDEFTKANHYIDAFELSRLRQKLEGRILLSDMKRVAEDLKSDEGSVSYEITGIVGDLGWPGAVMKLNGHLVLECSRCFKPLDFELDREVVFRFAKNEDEADAIPIEEDDDTEVIVGSQKLNILDWVEEEVLLSIPLVPRHEEECIDVDEILHEDHELEEEKKANNPFAKLKELKGLRSK